MFDNLKAMGAVAGLLKNKEKLREVTERFQARLERMSVTGVAGGSAVRVTVSGKMQVTEVFLDPALVAGLQVGDGGREMAQALIAEATNDAITRIQLMIREEADREARDLGLPGIPGLDGLLG
ncbi:MAG: YbaB/EbfC family nucleoid-associated protein [Phycisphaerales bacterium]|nr:YbaB/EbfC family nucleoid-associated protein [Phycisphaerales bacterium]